VFSEKRNYSSIVRAKPKSLIACSSENKIVASVLDLRQAHVSFSPSSTPQTNVKIMLKTQILPKFHDRSTVDHSASKLFHEDFMKEAQFRLIHSKIVDAKKLSFFRKLHQPFQHC
jgi:hypothetical protein